VDVPDRNPNADRHDVAQAAATLFGHRQLRPGQHEAVTALLTGHDVLLVAPTGGGKSLTYQLAGLLLGGTTVVVSPLLALQQDQEQSLLDRRKDDGRPVRTARISSARSSAQRREAVEALGRGELDFAFLAPEQLVADDVADALRRCPPTLVAVDEAHCVSTWGHDFRPDYLRVGELVGRCEEGGPRIIAMTATAARPVRDDIVSRLCGSTVRVIVTRASRDNIHLAVRRCVDEADQQEAVLEAGLAEPFPRLVYVRTRSAAEEYAERCAASGRPAQIYHAGLAKRRREESFEAFMSGGADLLIATNAFGMGVDKPDIRAVLHAQVPGSLDDYYQEVGRGGRDGRPAQAVLFYRPEDLGLARYFLPGRPDRAKVAAVVGAAARLGGTTDRSAVAEHSGVGARAVGRILNLLTEAGDETGDEAGDDPVELVLRRADAQRTLQQTRIEMMRAYAETQQCRRVHLMTYFGAGPHDLERELPEGVCGACDTCDAGTAQRAAEERSTGTSADFDVEQPVVHDAFGRGVVMAVDRERVTVLFQDAGYRELAVGLVRAENLLRPA
jgi:ATP-dependent DNA helicase RecQ